MKQDDDLKMYDEEEEQLDDLDDTGDSDYRKYKLKVIFISGLIGTIVILLGILAYLILFKETPKINHDEEEDTPQEFIDVSLIPSIELADEVFARAWEENFGMSMGEFLTKYANEDNETFTLPGTNTSLPLHAVSGEVATMALVQMAYQKNPFMIDDESPKGFAYLESDIQYGSSITLPDGEKMDLKRIVQDYSEVRYFVDTTNPLKYKFQGFVDGGHFTEEVDLTPMYSATANM